MYDFVAESNGLLADLKSLYLREEGDIYSHEYIPTLFGIYSCDLDKDAMFVKRCSDIINNLLDNTNVLQFDFSDFLENVYSFSKFIVFSDIAFFYINDDSSQVYAENNKGIYTIYFRFEEFKVKISFEESQVPMPKSSFLDDDKTVTFVDIEIAREYGKHIVNSSKYILGENISEKNSKESNILLSIVANKINTAMVFTFKEILQKAINEYLNIQTVNIDNLFENGLYIHYKRRKRK